MIKINSKVLVGSSKVEGLVVDIEETTGSVLVKHLLNVDGKSKTVQQWYNQNAAEEVIEKVEVKVEKKVKSSKKIKTEPVIELGILPETEKSDSNDK